MNVQTFHVAGMSCDHCVRAVTEEMSKLPGVERVDVDLATGEVAVTCDRALGDAEVAAAVDEAGYELVEAR
jgi:copper ion binding protein